MMSGQMPGKNSEVWLITGGAGYIGSHIANEFLSNGKEVVIYDSLVRGLESRVRYLREKHDAEVPLEKSDIRDFQKFKDVLLRYKPIGIVHTAALKSVPESIANPTEYMDVNFGATKKILEIAIETGLNHFIFSSTAAVYASPINAEAVAESDPTSPISPYGKSKLLAEREVTNYLSETKNFGTSLRFFNVIGTSSRELEDKSTENLFPIVKQMIANGRRPIIFGGDYPTPDGTCIRDFVDVRDVARAHLFVANHLGKLPNSLNIGTGTGVSVETILRKINTFMGLPEFEFEIGPRRNGDPAILFADVSKIEETLAFKSIFNLDMSLKSLI